MRLEPSDRKNREQIYWWGEKRQGVVVGVREEDAVKVLRGREQGRLFSFPIFFLYFLLTPTGQSRQLPSIAGVCCRFLPGEMEGLVGCLHCETPLDML